MLSWNYSHSRVLIIRCGAKWCIDAEKKCLFSNVREKKVSFDYIIETIANYLIIVKIQRELNSAVLVKPFTLSLYQLREHWAHSRLAELQCIKTNKLSTHLITEWWNTPEWLKVTVVHLMTIPITLLFAAVLLVFFFNTLNQSGSVVICSNDSYFFPFLSFVSGISQTKL